MTEPHLVVNNVNKKFGEFSAITNVSFSISAGNIIALMGHNGAGKTTLLKMILGFLSQDSGEISILNFKPGSIEARKVISYLPEFVAFPSALTGEEVINFYAKLKGQTNFKARSLLAKVDLINVADQKIGTYSKGMRQRLGLAQALIGEPKLILLDEPTTGLDPISRQSIFNLLIEFANNGTSILLSSHAINELESCVDRVMILAQGYLVTNNTLTGIKADSGLPIRFKIWTKTGATETVLKELGANKVDENIVELRCDINEKLKFLSEIAKLKKHIDDVELVFPDLEMVYRKYATDASKGVLDHVH